MGLIQEISAALAKNYVRQARRDIDAMRDAADDSPSPASANYKDPIQRKIRLRSAFVAKAERRSPSPKLDESSDSEGD